MTEEKKDQKSEDLEKKLEECEKKASEYLAGWQRAKADFINHKKEEKERIEGILQYIEEDFILKILPILDNFYLAEERLPEDFKKNENPEKEPLSSFKASIKGFLQIKIQIEDFLKNHGIEKIKSTGEKFDPNLHEAIETSDLKDDKKGEETVDSGIIVEEIQKGYTINGRLLRPAKVRVLK